MLICLDGLKRMLKGGAYDNTTSEGIFHGQGAFACDFVEYWPLFESIAKELYPFMEPRMMY